MAGARQCLALLMRAFSIKFVIIYVFDLRTALRLVCDAVHILILLEKCMHALDNVALSAELSCTGLCWVTLYFQNRNDGAGLKSSRNRGSDWKPS